MRSERPLDVHQHNSLMLMAQTGSRVYAPAFEIMPTPKLSGIVRVALILGGSIVGWAAVIGFVVLVQGLVH